ncbi:hypothetical protein AE30_01900 [Acinetobacter baumannii BIDMC 56]|nr:hypothetical protein W9G_00444 [Acinetobacter baumannii Ab11111]KDF05000.1 hypothetical protein AE30_01900 [Acinetobacter baumannii BIDMC 56]
MSFMIVSNNFAVPYYLNVRKEKGMTGEFKHEVRQFQKPYDNQQAEQISLMV